MSDQSSSRTAVVAMAKQALLQQAVALVGGGTPEDEARFLERVGAVLAATSEDELFEVVQRLETVGDGWGYYPPNDFARRMHHVMGDVAITSDSRLVGLEQLDTGDAPILLLPNHLSYADANLVQILLTRNGREALASRMTVVAGPKVYSELFRRFSALCFGTIKTPQSSSRASGEAVMSAREVARLALQTIEQARERLGAGDALLVFAEGSRSRDAAMQPTLAAVARYFDFPGLKLVPIGIAGSERLIPIGASRAEPTKVALSIGPPIEAGALVERAQGKKRLVMDVVGLSIAAQLPPSYRGAYADDTPGLDEAREIARSLAG
jgi:1-acyl-sn-glycerol-3-phosphate acyltransferase